MALVKITIIVARDKNDRDAAPWIIDAFDEYTMDENPSAFESELETARKSHGIDDVAVGVIKVPGDFLDNLFKPREISCGAVKQ